MANCTALTVESLKKTITYINERGPCVSVAHCVHNLCLQVNHVNTLSKGMSDPTRASRRYDEKSLVIDRIAQNGS